MFDFELSSHPYFDNACRDFANRHNLAKLAQRAGIKPQTLRNKLNPEQFHELTVKEMLSLIAITEDMSLMDGALSQLNCLPAVAVNELATESLPVYVMKATSEIGQLAAGAISTERMTASCKRGLLQNVNTGIRCLTLAALAVQARIQANPTMASTVDAISGLGASIGLS